MARSWPTLAPCPVSLEGEFRRPCERHGISDARRFRKRGATHGRICDRLYHVPGNHLARAKAFYGETLGLAPGDVATESWVEFAVAGGTFGIGNFPQVGTPGPAQSLALEVADLGAFRASLAERGIAVDEPHVLPSCAIAVVRDPDGNAIWLHQSKPR